MDGRAPEAVAGVKSTALVSLVESVNAVWEEGALPADVQRKLLKLTSGKATFGTKAGTVAFTGPSEFYLELPDRITLQLGKVEVDFNDRTEVDAPFGLALIDGHTVVESLPTGMTANVVRGTLTLQSPSREEWKLGRGDFRLLTSIGQLFEWHILIDRHSSTLAINGETIAIPPRSFSTRAAKEVSDALSALIARVQGRRLEARGLLSIDGVPRIYNRVNQIPQARTIAIESIAQADAVREALRKASKKSKRGTKLNLLSGKPLLPTGWGESIEDTVARALKAPEAMTPFAGSPRMQTMTPAALTSQLMTAPTVEIYHLNSEGVAQIRTVGRMANLTAVSTAPPREPLFEMLPSRPDLQGLPYQKGKDCLLSVPDRNAMAMISRLHASMGTNFTTMSLLRQAPSPTLVAGMCQIMQAKSDANRLAMTHMLRVIGSEQAVGNLVRRATFDLNPLIRDVAVTSLVGHESEIRHELLKTLRYPWAPAAMHAAEALVRLDDKDSVDELVDMLDLPHPSAPQRIDGHWVTRELVAINHMQNCLLCHPPSTSPRDLMRTAIPLPPMVFTGKSDDEDGNETMPLVVAPPPPRTYYGRVIPPRTPAPSTARGPRRLSVEGFVRADIAYLRQDFSIATQTSAYKPWPTLQRFDFLVRTRRLTSQERAVAKVEAQLLGHEYPQKKAVLFALQHLTGLTLGADSGLWRTALLQWKAERTKQRKAKEREREKDRIKKPMKKAVAV